MCLFIVKKEKEKKIQKKRNIKSRKINKRKRKILVSKVFYNNNDNFLTFRDKNYKLLQPNYFKDNSWLFHIS